MDTEVQPILLFYRFLQELIIDLKKSHKLGISLFPLGILHFLAHNLMVTSCEREQDPVAFAQGLLSEIEEMFAEAPDDAPLKAKLQERMTAFFGQVVSTLRSKTSHHDA